MIIYAIYSMAVLLGIVSCGSSKVATSGMAANTATAPVAAGFDTLVTDYELDDSVFANPERGFYIYTDLHQLDPDIGRRREEGHTLIWGRINMEDYRDIAFLPESFLAAIENGFVIARDQGMKVIVRGSYGFKGPDGDYTSYQDPAKDHIKKHIEQLAPIFAANADVIALFEAGFIGPWGEWHTTKIAEDYDQGREMLFHILDHTPTDRLVLVRYPYLKQQIFKEAGGFAMVDAGNAHSGERVARVGHHNDCFLASSTDFGTYERGEMTRAEEVAYLAGETLYTAFGGETCQMHELNDCRRALSELVTLKGSYLNSGYHPEVLDKWVAQGCFDEVSQRLGARFVLTESRIVAMGGHTGQLAVAVELENWGFAALYNARDVEIVLENEASGAVLAFAVDADPRQWKPGQAQVVNTTLVLPEDLAPGVYTAHLHLPDPSPRLRDDPRYAVRVANSGVWDGERGYNKLASGIVVGEDGEGKTAGD